MLREAGAGCREDRPPLFPLVGRRLAGDGGAARYAGFAAASKSVSPAAVAELISCGPSAEHHLQSIDRYVQAGFDHIILVQVGPEQEAFIEFFERHLAPALSRRKAA